jgi:3-deoxy-D-manno-octulosonic-acid transferase
VRRSDLPIDADPRADVVVLDTLGELAQVYQLATAVFVGGSLADHGGHNILEPAVFGKPIVFGPHMQNFKEIADAFVANAAAIQVHSESELDAALRTLVMDPVGRARLAPPRRIGRSQSRSQEQDPCRDCRPASADRIRQRRSTFRLVH